MKFVIDITPLRLRENNTFNIIHLVIPTNCSVCLYVSNNLVVSLRIKISNGRYAVGDYSNFMLSNFLQVMPK
jgi:hypothetical protein